MAGIVALELGNSDVNLTFKGGREDCAESPGDSADHTYPEPIMDRHEMYDWFLNSVDGFGMDENKVIVFFLDVFSFYNHSNGFLNIVKEHGINQNTLRRKNI